jgi:hypothetical protein
MPPSDSGTGPSRSTELASVRRALALLLLAGTLLFAVGAACHPHLMGSPEAQLATIADSAHWRAIHLALATGSALVICGVWCYALPERPAQERTLTIAALVLFTVGQAVNALNTIYMTGAGATIAALHAAGTPGMPVLFQATHPFGLVAARFGNLVVALSALLLGWLGTHDRTDPRWLGILAWIAGVVGLMAVIILPENSLLVLLPVALMCFWQAGVVLSVFRSA